jgi:hypothetical protein
MPSRNFYVITFQRKYCSNVERKRGFFFSPPREGSSFKTRDERAVMKSLEREEHYPLKRSTFTASNEKPSLEVT